MIKAIIVTNYLGESLFIDLFDPASSGLIVSKIDGLGPVKSNINMSNNATMDGSKFNSSKINYRNILLQFIFYNSGDIEATRQMTYRFFPEQRPLKLTVIMDHRIAEILGYTEHNDPNIFSKDCGSSISIICPDPYFYSVDPNDNTETLFSNIEPTFEFPFSNESVTEPQLEFSTIFHKKENTILYDGDVETGITIKIHFLDAVTNIRIYNVDTREKMTINTKVVSDIIKSPIKYGDDIIICTEPGRKSALFYRDGNVYNILNALEMPTSWFMLYKGENKYSYTADSGDTNMQFTITHRILYEGL